jgi:hypothetical protein
MATKFRVKIIKTEEVLKKTTEYQKVADSGNEKDGKAIYAYVPVQKTEVAETTIMDCVTDNLDVNLVIKSIYGL